MKKIGHIPAWPREEIEASDRGKRHSLVPISLCHQNMSMCLLELRQETGGLFVNLLIPAPGIWIYSSYSLIPGAMCGSVDDSFIYTLFY